VEDEAGVGFVFNTVAWWCFGGGYDVLERRPGSTEAAFEVACNVEDAFEEWHLHLTFAWADVEEETRVIAYAGNTQHHACKIERDNRGYSLPASFWALWGCTAVQSMQKS
jgi:hypothetical protein